MNEELHIFIIWSQALHIQQQIINDIKKHLEIKKVFKCRWNKEYFALRLAQFYHKKLYHCCKKEKDCGSDDFLLIVVVDHHPQLKNNNKNITIMELKKKYRNWSEGNYLIHASDTQKEAEDNLKFLLHMNIQEFLNKYPETWDNTSITPLIDNFPPITLIERLLLKLIHILRSF